MAKQTIHYRVAALICAAFFAVGCEPARRDPAPPPEPEAAAEPAQQAIQPPAPQPAEPADTKVTPADVGVGKRGRNLGQGPVSTPVATYFAAKEQIAFRVEVPQAMNLFKATNGHAPQSHDEFMKEIIQANNIQLPELPAGDRYVYDPAQEQLMVEQPQ